MSSTWTLRRASLSAGLGCIVGALFACDVQGKSPVPASVSAASPAAAESTRALPEPPILAPPPPALAEEAPAPDEQVQLVGALTAAWRFQTAAPITGAAAVTEEGFVYVTSVEGFVHALGPTGQFRWSRGLTGVPLGSPAVDRAGHIYVATSARRIYAVEANGRLRWMYPTAARVATAPIWTASGTLFFGARDRQVYALASWGGPLWNRRVDRVVTVAPALVDGALVVGSGEAQLSVLRASSGGTRVDLPGELAQPVLSNRDYFFVVAGRELVAFDLGDRSVVWRRNARYAALSDDGERLVAEARGELHWLDPATGAELHSVALPDNGSDAPALSNAGIAMVPLVSGELFLAAPGRVAGERVGTARVTVTAAPLWRPTWSERRQTVLAASGNGTLCAIDLGPWHTALRPESDGEAAPEPRSEVSPREEAEPRSAEVEAKVMGSAGGGA